jgi:hypothetical protein
MKKLKTIIPSTFLILICLVFSTTVVAEESRENAYYDANVEQDIGKVWQAYHDALKRKDADAAADLLVSSEDMRQEFRKNRDKLPKLAKDIASLSSCKIHDGKYAMCTAIRVETVKGEKKNIEYPVNFWKGNGGWKLESP